MERNGFMNCAKFVSNIATSVTIGSLLKSKKNYSKNITKLITSLASA